MFRNGPKDLSRRRAGGLLMHRVFPHIVRCFFAEQWRHLLRWDPTLVSVRCGSTTRSFLRRVRVVATRVRTIYGRKQGKRARRGARTLLLFASCALVACSPHGASSPRVGSWPMYQLRSDHNAVLPRKGYANAWSFDVGARVNGGLAWVDGILVFGTFANEVIGLDASSGKLLWRTRLSNVVMSTPIVADGTVYVGTGHNGRLHQPPDNRYTYTPSSGGDPTWGRPEGDEVVALDLTAGSKRWSLTTIGEDMPSPAILDGVLVFANGDLHAYGVAASSGRLLWTKSIDGFATMASAISVNGIVIMSACNDAPYRCTTFSVEPRTGKVIWRSNYGNSDSSPTYGDGRVFVSGVEDQAGPYSNGGRTVVTALDSRSGTRLWQRFTQIAAPYTEVGSNERAIAGTYNRDTYFQPIPGDDVILAFDAATGRTKWRFKSLAPIKMSPVVSDHRVYFADGAGLLYVLDEKTGTMLTSRAFRRGFTVSPPVIVGETLFIANDSVVYAVPTSGSSL